MSEGASEPKKEPVRHSFQRVFLTVFLFAFLTAETLIYVSIAFAGSFWALFVLYVLVPLVFSFVAARSSGKGKEYSKPVPALVSPMTFIIVSARFWGVTVWYLSWWLVGGVGLLLGLAYLLAYDATLSLARALWKSRFGQVDQKNSHTNNPASSCYRCLLCCGGPICSVGNGIP